MFWGGPIVGSVKSSAWRAKKRSVLWSKPLKDGNPQKPHTTQRRQLWRLMIYQEKNKLCLCSLASPKSSILKNLSRSSRRRDRVEMFEQKPITPVRAGLSAGRFYSLAHSENILLTFNSCCLPFMKSESTISAHYNPLNFKNPKTFCRESNNHDTELANRWVAAKAEARV